MTLHLLKLCVGCDSIDDLADWQQRRLRELKKKRKPAELIHITRQTPKRSGELLKGGSLYWVIRGQIAVRQRLMEIRAVTKNGAPHCGLVYEPKLVHIIPRYCRPFQGWRYLAASNAPPDIRTVKGSARLPPQLRAELAALGLL